MVNLVVSPEQINDRKFQAHILKWLKAVANLTKKSDTTVNENWLSDIGQALLENLPSWVFSRQSCNFVASKHTFFPSFKEMMEDLKDWADLEDRRKTELKIEHQEAIKNAADFPQPVRNWVASYVKHSGSNWKYDDAQSPNLQEQEARDKRFQKLMKAQCPEAYEYLFPREAKENIHTFEERIAQQKIEWADEKSISKTIEEIKNLPSLLLQGANIKFLKTGVSKYAPHLIDWVDQEFPAPYAHQKEEKKQGFFA